MSAIVKAISIHGKPGAIAKLVDYARDIQKTDLMQAMINSDSDYLRTEYDPLQAQFGIGDMHKTILVDGVNCNVGTASLEFEISKELYGEQSFVPFNYTNRKTGETYSVQRQSIEAVHLIQSFAEPDIDPYIVHQIGIELVERLDPQAQAVVATHMNKYCLHNHIILDAYKTDGSGKITNNMETLNRIRTLSDEIQLEYGLEVKFLEPEKQLQVARERDNAKGTSYQEWQQDKAGNSWKAKMCNDMHAIADVVDTRSEFIDMMDSYGYSVVRETDTSITWENNENGKKIRDTTLDAELSIAELFPKDIPNRTPEQIQELLEKQARDKKRIYLPPVEVSRYTWDGHRRTELEMILRSAIAILQKIERAFANAGNPDKQRIVHDKISTIDKALNIMKEKGINSIPELKAQIADTTSHIMECKSMLRDSLPAQPYFSEVKENAEYIKNVIDQLGHGHLPRMDVMCLYTYDETKINERIAKDFPITSFQRGAIYTQLKKHPELHLAIPFNQLSALHARDLLNYFNGHGEFPTRTLLTSEQYQQKYVEQKLDTIYEKAFEHLQGEFKDTPMSDRQQKQLSKLLLERGIDIDVATLSKADCINIKNCFADNPFPVDVKLITSENVKWISEACERFGLTLNREPEFVTEKEFLQLQKFINGYNPEKPSRYLPDLLKAEKMPDEVKAKKIDFLEKALAQKEIILSVPLDKMSDFDLYKVESFVSANGRTPHCLEPHTPTNKELDKQFADKIADLPQDKKELFIDLRNHMNKMRQHGIHPYAINPILEHAEAYLTATEQLKQMKAEYIDQNKELLSLQRTISDAQSPQYIYEKDNIDRAQVYEINNPRKDEHDLKEYDHESSRENEYRNNEFDFDR